ncbi:MAG: ribonuclease PH [Candidatus Firestonebacteria bacterium]
MRIDGRKSDELRNIKITRNFNKYAEGSVLIEAGNTKVICTATVTKDVPSFLKDTGQGWITAEYGMLPRSTHTRIIRESARGKTDGRTQEIQRLIGRSLRSIVDLESIGQNTIFVDADVIQADGGTRTLSITGAFISLVDAINFMREKEMILSCPIKDYIAAISVGVIKREKFLDLCYEEDKNAEVDMNVIMTGSGEFVEIQGTAEKTPFAKSELDELLALASDGIKKIINIQKQLVGNIVEKLKAT